VKTVILSHLRSPCTTVCPKQTLSGRYVYSPLLGWVMLPSCCDAVLPVAAVAITYNRR
jgi:hypothetical protein